MIDLRYWMNSPCGRRQRELRKKFTRILIGHRSTVNHPTVFLGRIIQKLNPGRIRTWHRPAHYPVRGHCWGQQLRLFVHSRSSGCAHCLRGVHQHLCAFDGRWCHRPDIPIELIIQLSWSEPLCRWDDTANKSEILSHSSDGHRRMATRDAWRLCAD